MWVGGFTLTDDMEMIYVNVHHLVGVSRNRMKVSEIKRLRMTTFYIHVCVSVYVFLNLKATIVNAYIQMM